MKTIILGTQVQQAQVATKLQGLGLESGFADVAAYLDESTLSKLSLQLREQLGELIGTPVLDPFVQYHVLIVDNDEGADDGEGVYFVATVPVNAALVEF